MAASTRARRGTVHLILFTFHSQENTSGAVVGGRSRRDENADGSLVGPGEEFVAGPSNYNVVERDMISLLLPCDCDLREMAERGRDEEGCTVFKDRRPVSQASVRAAVCEVTGRRRGGRAASLIRSNSPIAAGETPTRPAVYPKSSVVPTRASAVRPNT